jgi:glutamate-1-semialdehyde 2,1-aminomutase
VLFGAQHAGEAELAERVVRLVPSADLVAFSNTGSEAVHAALRIARAATRRRLLVKFDGHYHGWLDPVYVSGPASPPRDRAGLGVHAVPGLEPPDDVIVCAWNSLPELAAVLAEHQGEVVAVIMEPLPSNFGNFEPLPGYLEGVRSLCDRNGILLIFDEVITGFRIAPGGLKSAMAYSRT